jgi:hypothetical protein
LEVDATHSEKETRTASLVKGGKVVAQDIQIEKDTIDLHQKQRPLKVESPGEFSRPLPPCPDAREIVRG